MTGVLMQNAIKRAFKDSNEEADANGAAKVGGKRGEDSMRDEL